MIGLLAKSLAGHDKGKIYLIIEETDSYLYLADGVIRKAAAPKKKKKKHLQLIKNGVDATLQKKLLAGITVSDEEIKKVIKLYRND